MKRRILSIVLTMAMLITMIAPVAVTTVSADDYVQITNQTELAAMTATGSYQLANDITISDTWNFTKKFKGELDGAGHTITFADGVTITGGLFQELQKGAYVHDFFIVQEGSATWNYYTTGLGATTGGIGAVAGYVGAGGQHNNTTNITNAANKIRIVNVDVTVNISESEAVSGSNEAAAIGGIVGEVGMYTEITGCTVSGSITDTYDHSAGTSYFSDLDRSSYGGIVGMTFRKTILLISECMNQANITGNGQQGGILGANSSGTNSETVCTLTIERCLNKGTITSTGGSTSTVSGIVGAVFQHNGNTVTIQNNINLGTLARTGGATGAGIVAFLRRGADNMFQFIGNVQESDKIVGNQIVYQQNGSGAVVFTNNYARGGGDSTYSNLSTVEAFQNAYNTLNAAYPGVFLYDDTVAMKIGLAWTVHTGEWIVDVEATCTTTGKRHFVCETCGKTIVEIIPAGHNYNEDGVCTMCGDKNYGEITSQADFETLIAAGTFNKYKLANDITISGTWNFSTPFAGEFDGCGYTITFAEDTVITGGLFCELQAGAYVHDVIIVQEGNATWNYYTTGNGAQTGSIGAVAAYVGAAGNHSNESYTKNASNKIRIANITATVNISESEAVSGSIEAAAIGGIVGEIGMYTEIKNCAVSGSITDTYNHSAENSYFNYNSVNFERSSYGGIVGLAFRKTVVLISECKNEANITGIGLQGGIIGGTPTCSNSETACNITIERCLNKGTITNTGSTTASTAGGIAGAIFSHYTTAIIQNNINVGKIVKPEGSIGGGIIGVLRRGQDDKAQILGNVQESDEIAGGQIVGVETGSKTIIYTNNFGRGAGNSVYGSLGTAEAYQTAYNTLNAAYPDVFFYDDTVSQKIGLRWTVHRGEWIIDVEATCTTVGSRHFVCETCGETFIEEIPKIAHNYDANETCTMCGIKSYAEITSQEELAALISTGDYKKYILLNDITISGTWNLSTPFAAEFDGAGHTITLADGVVITGGLFCELRAGAYIHDFSILQAGDATWNYYVDGTGSTTGNIGAVAAFIGAAGNHSNNAYITNTANKIRIANVNATVVISESTAVSGSNEAAAIGGIVGEIGMYTEITRCTVSGSITDTYDHTAGTSYFSDLDRSSYGGIVGMTFRKTVVLISECMSEAEITGKGQQGGILGANSSSTNSSTACNITIEKCLNKGTITSTGGNTSTVAGIVGALYSEETTATLWNNINVGEIVKTGSATAGGIVAVLRRGQDEKVKFLGNVQQSDKITGNQIVTTQNGSKTVVFTNNFGRGNGDTTYGTLKDDAAYQTAFSTLNTAYPGVFRYDETVPQKIILRWTAHVHTWDEWIIDVDSTCTEAGSRHRMCTECGATEYEAIPAGHHFNSDGVCTVCGAVETEYVMITDQATFLAAIVTNSKKDADGKALGKFRLANDITISGNWDLETIFRGELDGAGHTVTFANGATITGGLFAALGANAYIHDLKIVQAGTATWNLKTSGTAGNAGSPLGGLAGMINAGVVNGVNTWSNQSFVANEANKVVIKNVTVTADITVNGTADHASVGGIIGDIGLYTEILNCVFNGSIKDTATRSKTSNQDSDSSTLSAYGGIVGFAFRPAKLYVTECVNNGDITGYGQVGGIVGSISPAWDAPNALLASEILRCANYGTLTCTHTTTCGSVGGIVGYYYVSRTVGSTGAMTNNVNYGTLVRGSTSVRGGGLVGRQNTKDVVNTLLYSGNIQLSENIGGGKQIYGQQDGEGAAVTYKNNYAVGGGTSEYNSVDASGGRIGVVNALNEKYPGVFSYDDAAEQKVVLNHIHVGKWIVDVESTCTAVGSRHIVCEICGETGVEEIPISGHTWGEWIVDQEPTCTETGVKHRVCAVCGEVENEITPTEHKWGEWIVDTAAACTELGTKHRVCSVCNEVENGTIPANGHNFVSGTCTVCGTSQVVDGYTLISKQAELASMSASGKYRLANDLVITGTWDYSARFTGTLEGDGHTITFADGAVIKGGLFEQIGPGATIQNLTIVQAGAATWNLVRPSGCNVQCIGTLVASIVGPQSAAGNITIRNISATAIIEVSGKSEVNVGGIVGEVNGAVGEVDRYDLTIEGCRFYGSITDHSEGRETNSTFAGILGLTYQKSYWVNILNCVNYADILGYSHTGGIMGYARHEWHSYEIGYGLDSLIIQGCANRGNVTAQKTLAGGIIARLVVVNGATAKLLNNINYGTVRLNAKSSDTYGGPGGICASIRFDSGVAEISGNINYGELLVAEGTTAPILNHIDNSYRLDGVIANGEVTNVYNYSSVDESCTEADFPERQGLMSYSKITDEASEINIWTKLSLNYPSVYTMTKDRELSLIGEVGDLDYLYYGNYRTRVSLNLSKEEDSIEMRFGVDASCKVPDTLHMIIEKNGEDIKNFAMSDILDEASGYYVISLPIPVAEIETEHPYAIKVVAEDGWEILADAFNMSAKQYAEEVLGEELYAEWHPLIQAVLAYGANPETAYDAYAQAVEASAGYTQPIIVAPQGIASYSIVYEDTADDYLKGAVLAFVNRLKQKGFTMMAGASERPFGKAIMLKTSEAVTGWTIAYDEDGTVTITGHDDLKVAAGFFQFANTVLKNTKDGSYIVPQPKNEGNSGAAYTRAGWDLAIPAYDGGTLASHRYDDGTGLAADDGSLSAERSYMMVISGTSESEFNAYASKLIANGFTLDSGNSMLSKNSKNNLYREYRRGQQLVYMYFNAETSEVRVIEDRVSTPESQFEYSFASNESTQTALYMYGMIYDEDGEGINNGAFYIIRQADNSLILLDGGGEKQATAAEVSALWAFLHEITGKGIRESLTISCWFVSHPHGDHYALVSGLIREYHNKLDLQRVMFNFPSEEEASVAGDLGIVGKIRDKARDYYPNVMFSKCHSGQSVHLGSLTLDVLVTHEDWVDAATGLTTMYAMENSKKVGKGNAMTSLIRFTFADGTRFMFTGDFDPLTESATVKMYNASELKSDIVSVAHHGYNKLPSLYAAIRAKYALWPNYSYSTFSGWKKTSGSTIYNSLKNAGAKNVYYAGLNTVKLLCQNGTISITTSTPNYKAG